MLQPNTMYDKVKWNKYKGEIRGKINVLLFFTRSTAEHTFRHVKEHIESYPITLQYIMEQTFNDFFSEQEKTPELVRLMEKESKFYTSSFNAKTSWSVYSRRLHVELRKIIHEARLKFKERTIDHIEIDENSFLVTVYITSLFRDENMIIATEFFMNKGATNVIFKIVIEIITNLTYYYL